FPIHSTVLNRIADVFPVRPLNEALIGPFARHADVSGGHLAVLLAWGVAGALIGGRRFRWGPRPPDAVFAHPAQRVLHLAPVLVGEPVAAVGRERAHARIGGITAFAQRIDVPAVDVDPAADLGTESDAAVPRHDDGHVRHGTVEHVECR